MRRIEWFTLLLCLVCVVLIPSQSHPLWQGGVSVFLGGLAGAMVAWGLASVVVGIPAGWTTMADSGPAYRRAVVLALFGAAFTLVKPHFSAINGRAADPVLAWLDTTLHRGPAVAWCTWLGDDVATLVYMAWFPLMVVVLAWSTWRSPRLVRAWLLLWLLGGVVLAGCIGSTGPVFTGEMPTPHNAYMAALQAKLLHHADAGTWFPGAGLSGMPSLHVATAALLVCVVWSWGWSWRVPGLGWLVFMHAASVRLGWHWAVDGYTGVLLAFACWRLAGVPFTISGAIHALRAFHSVGVPAGGLHRRDVRRLVSPATASRDSDAECRAILSDRGGQA